MSKILVIDDERIIRRTLREIISNEGHDVVEAEDGELALKQLEVDKYDVIFCDLKMPKISGIEVIGRLQELGIDTPVIMISGHGNIETAVESIKKGAFDFITKPIDLNRLLITLRNAIDRVNLVTEAKVLKRKIYRVNEMIGESEPMMRIKEIIERVAPTDARVLVTGGNGTGKELVAKWIHEKSNRNNGPLIEVNCAAIPSELIESELFGHEKGAFTSAIKQRIGKFEQANGGTLFLDEIGDMSLSAQAKVLRALQENKITRVGGEKEFPVNVRVIAATNKDLKKEIADHNFREDLYHRLSVILIQVPTLNERSDDIPMLAEYFLSNICQEYNSPNKKFTPEALKELQQINWSGNIRELRNAIERLIILCDKVISDKDVRTYVGTFAPQT